MREELFRFRFCAGGGENPSFSPPPPPRPPESRLTATHRCGEISRGRAETLARSGRGGGGGGAERGCCGAALPRLHLSSREKTAELSSREKTAPSSRERQAPAAEISRDSQHPSPLPSLGKSRETSPSPPHPSAAAQIPPFLVAAALFLTSFYYSNKYKSRGGSPPSGPAYKT